MEREKVKYTMDFGNVRFSDLTEGDISHLQDLCKKFAIKGELPHPVIRDGKNKFVKDYTWLDWIAKLNEELDEVKYAVSELEDKFGYDTFDEEEGLHTVAMELQDLITVATSMQKSYLGYDEAKRQAICAEVNEKNHKRGYFAYFSKEE